MKLFNKLICLVVLLFCFVLCAHAQFETVYIGVNGLTCSQCSRTVEMRIRKLDFVDDVQMNLQHTEGKIILNKNKKAEMEKIAQAVIDAGFSVRYLQADFNMNNSIQQTGQCFKFKGDGYVFTQASKETMSGVIKLKFIGKKYLPKNELKKMDPFIPANCESTAGNVYHVTLVKD
jgi:copper chaperone CopZ